MRAPSLAVPCLSLLSAVLAPHALTQDERPTTPEEAASAIEQALGRGENPGIHLQNAEDLRDDFTDKEFAVVIKAAGQAFKTDKRLSQCLVMESYQRLKLPGSYEHMERLMKVPDEVEGTLLRNTYALAIETAGVLADPDAVKPLEKLVMHPDRRFARTAARSLAHFTSLKDKDKAKLVDRLVKTLGKVERDLGHKKEDVAKRADDVTRALDATLVALTELGQPEAGAGDQDEPPRSDEGPVAARTADEWAELVAAARKQRK